MRDIEYRAKIIKGVENSGQWRYFSIQGSDEWSILDKDTIGQFVGWFDKNSKRIFEGDIVKIYRHSEETNKHEFKQKAEVIFRHSMFCLTYIDKNSYILGNKGEKLPNKIYRSFDSLWNPGESLEVIGNKHDGDN